MSNPPWDSFSGIALDREMERFLRPATSEKQQVIINDLIAIHASLTRMEEDHKHTVETLERIAHMLEGEVICHER